MLEKHLILNINCQAEIAEILADFLWEEGALGIEMVSKDDFAKELKADHLAYLGEDFLSTLQAGYLIKAYFPTDFQEQSKLEQKLEAKTEAIREFFPQAKIRQSWENLETRPWEEIWQEHYKVTRINPELVIKPIKLDYQAQKGEIVIALDPGMAFGSGTHASTKTCLDLLSKLDVTNKSLLDLGTGSGILSILASKKGARVEALDLDPKVIQVAKDNAQLNQVDYLVQEGSIEEASQDQYDIIVANIIVDVLIKLLGAIKSKAKETIILAGILAERAEEMRAEIKKQDLKISQEIKSEGWVAYVVEVGD